MNNRNTYFDFLRAIAIIMVIAIHTYKVGDSIVLRQFVNGAVPIFVAISGFFISKKEVLTKTQYFTFIQRQIPKVYVPALFFMAPLFISNITSGESFFKSMVYFVICNYSVYYFIAFIIQCYVALPLIKVSVNKYKKCGGVSFILSVAWIGFYTYLKNEKNVSLPLVAYASPLPCWLMFFYLGVYLGQQSDRKYSLSWPLLITTTGLLLSIASCVFLDWGDGIKPTAFIYSMGLILVLFSYKLECLLSRSNIMYNIMMWLGRQSFVLYLFHMYIIVYVVDDLEISNWIVRIFITLLMTSSLIIIFRWIFPKSVRYWFGYSD